MTPPATIAVHDLASPRNAVSRDVWAAVRAGTAALYFRSEDGSWEYRFDDLQPYDPSNPLLFVLWFLGTEVAACKANDIITVERLE